MTLALTLVALRYAVLAGWLVVLYRLRRRAWRAFGHEPQHGDPLFAVLWGFGAVSIFFSMRYLVFNGEPDTAGERAWLTVAYLITLALQVVACRVEAWERD